MTDSHSPYAVPAEKELKLVSNKPIARFLDPDRSGSPAHRFREQRNAEFKRRFPDLADMCVLDLGGTAVSWRVTGLRAHSVTIVNTSRAEGPEESWIKTIQGDACTGGFGKFDIVFSNSVLEHLGGHARRQQFADVVQESAPAWWVQTPNRYFPVEPHWLFPGFQFLPFPARVLITQHWNVGHNPALRGKREAAALVASTELISGTEMRAYFPDSEIWSERIAGIPKSIVAIKGGA
jgi:hypothetical protein